MSVQLTIDQFGRDAISSTGGNGVAVEASDGSQSAIIGTNTNDNAKAGNIGEYVTATLAAGSAISLTNLTGANVTSISLTAGDWDVWGAVFFVGSATITTLWGAVSTTSASVGTAPSDGLAILSGASSIVGTTSLNARTRISIAATTTVYLVAQANFSGSSATAFGKIAARRVR